MNKILITVTMISVAMISFFVLGAKAEDLGFRYVNGKCVNSSNQEGLNPSYFGQCGDLRGTAIARLSFDNIDMSGTQFSSADLQKSTFKKAILVGVNFDETNLSGVELLGAKIENA